MALGWPTICCTSTGHLPTNALGDFDWVWPRTCCASVVTDDLLRNCGGRRPAAHLW
jgi:hypothetical protein